MAYADSAALARDPEFAARVTACLCEESRGKLPADTLAQAVMRNPTFGVQVFMPFTSTAPGFVDAYGPGHDDAAITDGMILSAVQADWATVRDLYPVDVG